MFQLPIIPFHRTWFDGVKGWSPERPLLVAALLASRVDLWKSLNFTGALIFSICTTSLL